MVIQLTKNKLFYDLDETMFRDIYNVHYEN
jgi:hypothetical protein